MAKTRARNSKPLKLLQTIATALVVGSTFFKGSVVFGQAQVNDHQLGTKFSSLTQIDKNNVSNLEVAWTFRNGDMPEGSATGKLISMQDQPTLIEGNLVTCSARRRLTALDPVTGNVRWTFDPKDPELAFQKCRGVGHWIDPVAGIDAVCKSRIFLGTADYRLVAIDAKSGSPCLNFGNNGFVKMPVSKKVLFVGEVAAGSNPVVVNGVVVVGSSVADSQRVDAPSGQVLAFDARTGELLWKFDPIPRRQEDPAMASWEKGTEGFGQGNVWSSMSGDEELGLVYLPTTSPSNDFYGGERPGDNHYTTSVVALKAVSGEVVWHQQLVHHNVFDYDIPTRPMLIDYPYNGQMVPALVQNTKMGLIFVFDRKTGMPLVPIEERAVPQKGAVQGEILSPTQPFPVGMPTILKQTFSLDDVWGFTPIDTWLCKKKVEELNFGGIYTPMSLKGTVMSPAAGGGPNWGGASYDPKSNIMVVPANRVPMVVTLIPREQALLGEERAIETTGEMVFENPGSPFAISVSPLLSAFGAPCVEPPWATLTAINIVKKEVVWEVPLGSIEKLSPIPIPIELGTPGAGGPLMTASGLVFIGYTLDNSIRAFDAKTGAVLWKHELPASANSMPVTYEANGEQYVVIPAGGHTMYGSPGYDAIVAFKLKN